MISMTLARGLALALIAPAALALTLDAEAYAAGTHADGHHAATHGAPGEAAAATRTVEVVMYDNYYEPESLEVKAGETVRFVIRNDGALVHEFNIGTATMHLDHQAEMQMMEDHGVLKPERIDHEAAKAMQAAMGHGMHEEPNSALVEPGGTAEIVWSFPESGEIEFACNVPGHYDAGMQGYFKIQQ